MIVRVGRGAASCCAAAEAASGLYPKVTASDESDGMRVGRGAVGAWPDMVERKPILASGADGAAPICSQGDAHGCVGGGDSASGSHRCTGGGEGGDGNGDGGGEGGGKVDGGGSTPDRDGGSDEVKAIASSALRSASVVFSKIRRPAQTAPSNFITVQVKRP